MSSSRYTKDENNQAATVQKKGEPNKDDKDKENLAVIFCRIPCAGAQGARVLKNLTKKLK